MPALSSLYVAAAERLSARTVGYSYYPSYTAIFYPLLSLLHNALPCPSLMATTACLLIHLLTWNTINRDIHSAAVPILWPSPTNQPTSRPPQEADRWMHRVLAILCCGCMLAYVRTVYCRGVCMGPAADFVRCLAAASMDNDSLFGLMQRCAQALEACVRAWLRQHLVISKLWPTGGSRGGHWMTELL